MLFFKKEKGILKESEVYKRKARVSKKYCLLHGFIGILLLFLFIESFFSIPVIGGSLICKLVFGIGSLVCLLASVGEGLMVKFYNSFDPNK